MESLRHPALIPYFLLRVIFPEISLPSANHRYPPFYILNTNDSIGICVGIILSTVKSEVFFSVKYHLLKYTVIHETQNSQMYF